jgi:hypothetical protein
MADNSFSEKWIVRVPQSKNKRSLSSWYSACTLPTSYPLGYLVRGIVPSLVGLVSTPTHRWSVMADNSFSEKSLQASHFIILACPVYVRAASTTGFSILTYFCLAWAVGVPQTLFIGTLNRGSGEMFHRPRHQEDYREKEQHATNHGQGDPTLHYIVKSFCSVVGIQRPPNNCLAVIARRLSFL